MRLERPACHLEANRRVRRRAHALAVAAIGVIMGVAVGSASAGGPGRTVIIDESPVVSVAANSSDGANARCGENYPAGGGFEIRNASVPFPAHVYRSAPQFGTPNGWRSNAWNPKAASGAVNLRSYVLCLKRLSATPSLGILYPEETTAAPAATKPTVRARCGQGYVPIGGGFRIDGRVLPNQPLTVLGSFPTEDPDGWAVEVLNPPGAPRIEITTTAVCLKAKRSTIDTLVSPTVLLGPQDADGTRVLCPEGSAVVGGGFRILPEELTAFPASPLNSNPIRRNGRTGWSTVAVNTAPHPSDLLLRTNRVRAFAICLK